MTENMKINLDKTYTSLKIMSTIAGAIIGLFVVYISIDARMDSLEQRVAVSEGVWTEKITNIEKKLDKVHDVVIEWEP